MRRSVLLGQTISDWQGDVLGRVIDTWPFDGGGEPELAVVRMGRLGQRRMVPISELIVVAGELRLPFARYQVEDSPPYGEDRHTLDDDPHCAASYWRWEEPVGSLTARCLLSSGFSGMERLFPTSPSPTPIAS
jgi:hypothetical protein